MSSNTTRMRCLDALRGLACLAIVLYHATDRTNEPLPHNLLQYPVRLILFGISQAYVGVFLFFVISGFCIHLQWARSRAAGKEPQIRFGAFWKRRIRRLYPPYAIALALFLLFTAWNEGLHVTRFMVYDVGMHLFMVHNLDPQTSYSISGIFWTLAIEEQLYLAYFLLLFLRIRWGWTVTLTICLLARVGWMIFGHVFWLKTGFGIPVPEAAASHWFTWALGAIAVEAMLGVIQIPRWCRNLAIASVAIVIASVISNYLPVIPKDTVAHHVGWYLIHPLWGLGFFILVNRLVVMEQGWVRQSKWPLFMSIFVPFGLISYSIYLTHELMIMQSWRWMHPDWLHLQNVFFVIMPATIVFAWIFFWFCERPFMTRVAVSMKTRASKPESVVVLKPVKEGFPSRAFLTAFRTRIHVRLRRGSRNSESGTEPAAGAVGSAARLANTYSDSIAVADGQN